MIEDVRVNSYRPGLQIDTDSSSRLKKRCYGHGGEEGIRIPGRSFSPYNGLAAPFHRLLFGINGLRSGERFLFGPRSSYSAAIVQPSAQLESDEPVCERELKSGVVPYLWHWCENGGMKEQAIRTTVDIPASLYRKLKEQAAAQGRSIRELILLGVRVTLIEGKRPRAKRVKFPLIASDGPKVDLTNEKIYEHIEFP